MLLKTFEWGNPDGPTLVCIHGVGGSHAMFRKIVEERWGKIFRVITFDLRGHGESVWDPPWNNATYVADIIDTIDHLRIDEADWVGVSFGGRLLLQVLAYHPERVRRACALEPVIQASPELCRRRALEELKGGEWDSLEDFFASRGAAAGDADPEEYLQEYAAEFERLPDGRVRRNTFQPAIVSIFSEQAAPSPPPETITKPTMILYAPAFGLVTPEQRAAYEPYVERFVEVPGSHAVFVTAFDETATAVEEFLTAD